MLKSVLDRYKYIDLVELPNDRQGPPVILLTDASAESSSTREKSRFKHRIMEVFGADCRRTAKTL
jgi:hypothetical protein